MKYSVVSAVGIYEYILFYTVVRLQPAMYMEAYGQDILNLQDILDMILLEGFRIS